MKIAEDVAAYLTTGEAASAVNLPKIPPEQLARARPYQHLAHALGGFVAAITPDPITELEVGLFGRAAELDPRPITSQALVGLLEVRPVLARGLILVTGPTGSGKSTTLAAMLDRINRSVKGHMITIEDPIEFIHKHQQCIVNQREVGSDTKSFQAALKYALRQDPDIVLIGEMRDLETIQAGLTIAETGHLAFATLHTNSAAEAVNRIIDVFPSHQQSQVRAQLAFCLEGIITQTLLPKIGGRGRAMAAEILVVTPAIRALIRDDKIHQIYSMMQSGKKYGMQTMNDGLYNLYMSKTVSLDEVLRATPAWEQ